MAQTRRKSAAVPKGPGLRVSIGKALAGPKRW